MLQPHTFVTLLAQGLANKSKYKEVQLEIQSLSHALRESTKHLCRNLKVIRPSVWHEVWTLICPVMRLALHAG